MSRQRFYLAAILSLLAVSFSFAQTPSPSSSPSPDPEAMKARSRAIELLESVSDRVSSLQSTGNRLSVTAVVADLLWEYDEKRARALFDGLAKDVASAINDLDFSEQESYNLVAQLQQQRQTLVERIARRDPEQALAFLKATRVTANGPRINNYAENERNLETYLAGVIASRNPELALRLAREGLKRGVSYNHSALLNQLQQKDPAAAQQFYKEVVERFASDDLADRAEAMNVGWNLLSSFQPPQANEETYKQLIETLVNRVLALTPGDTTRVQMAQNIYYQTRWILPQVEKYLPMRAAALRQWGNSVERTFDPNTRMFNELNDLAQKGTVDDILALIPRYPEEMQPQIAQQAINKAASEGNADRARQIAKEMISDPVQRTQLLAQIENQVAWKAISETKVEEARRASQKIKPLDQRAQVLTQLAGSLERKGDKAAARDLLDEARALLANAPSSSQKFAAQLQLARSYLTIDPDETAKLLQALVTQANQLIAAAAVLDGFDIRYMQQEEWLANGYYGLNSLISNLDQVLGQLAVRQFSTAASMADQIERPEVKLFAQLAIAEAVLSGKSINGPNGFVTRRIMSVN